jgi:hypothetical protein
MKMAARLTDDELKIRHSTLHVVLAALGYVNDDSSKSTIMDVQRRFNAAVAEGRMAKDGEGQYRLTREYYDRQVKRNGEQSRRRSGS